MNTRLTLVLAIVILAISIFVGAHYYPLLPSTIASHWDAAGNPNGTLPKFWGVFLFPMIMVFVLGILFLVRYIDPKKDNIDKFEGYFNVFILLISLFFLYLEVLTIFFVLYSNFNMTQLLIPALAVLFFDVGIVLAHAEPNWSIGLRTPWTLENPTVWRKTHALGSKLFKIAAVVSLIGFFFPALAIWLFIAPVLLAALISFIYSYVIYRKKVR